MKNKRASKKTYLKYLGNKTKHAERIEALFGSPCTGTYYEPFCGSCAVFFARVSAGTIKGAVLSDTNKRLIETHRSIQEDVDSVWLSLAALPWGTNWKPHYDRIRRLFNQDESRGPKHAARYIWLNRTGFNGLFRVNRKGEFNVPAGDYAQAKAPEKEVLEAVAACFKQGAGFEIEDFEKVIDRAGASDHVYADPPFLPISKTSSFAAYDNNGFNTGEHQRLASALVRATERGATVVASNSVAAKELYGDLGFEIETFEVKRSISSKASTRGKLEELLMLKRPSQR